MNVDTKTQNEPEPSGKTTKARKPTPKWAVTVNDEPIPMPQRHIKVSVIREQAAIEAHLLLVRDHESPNDFLLRDEETIDLAEGNVFYTLEACDVKPHANGHGPAKLAYFVDDRPELTVNPNQTGQTIRDLFGLRKDVNLIRDYESSHDEPVLPDDPAHFENGPVFITRREHVQLTITVNHK